MIQKSFEFLVKDVDEKLGVVDIMVSGFGNEDTDGETIVKGAYKKTIRENLKRIKHFKNHDWRILLGLPREFEELDKGLRVLSKLMMKVDDALKIFEIYKAHIEEKKNIEHSVGIDILQVDKNDGAILTELKLWEFSTLTAWGANEVTPVLGLKSMEIDNIAGQLQIINRVLKNDKLKHSQLLGIESEANILLKRLKSLKEPQPHSEPSNLQKYLDDSINKLNPNESILAGIG